MRLDEFQLPELEVTCLSSAVNTQARSQIHSIPLYYGVFFFMNSDLNTLYNNEEPIKLA